MYRYISLISSICIVSLVSGQNKFIDPATEKLFDSLDLRINWLQKLMPRISSNRDANYFATKRELDMTMFLREYHELVFDEKLEEADKLIDSRISASEKRADKFAADYYTGYKTKLTRLRGEKRTYYQQLFTKEKNFRKEFEKFVDAGDEYSLNRAARMVDLAINYAGEQKMTETLKFLIKYKRYAAALLYDLKSDYNLKELTSSQKSFQKVFNPMTDSDSLQTIIEAGKLVDQCYNYSLGANSKVDTNFFDQQKNVVANAIADWNERQGNTAELATLTGQSIVAKLDSVNREGIYKWKGMILVIGTVKFTSKSDNVRRGEAIIASDQTLKNYIRVNKLADQDLKKAKIGKSYMVSYFDAGKKTYFMYEPEKQHYQYMICYSDVINEKATLEMIKFLPPLQFREEIGK
jgi:hypothetical protein